MEKFLTSNEWQWRLARTVVQGVLGVLVANVDLIIGFAVLDPAMRALVVARMTGCDSAIVKATGGKGYSNGCFVRHADETLAAGDQTGRESRIQGWYRGSWDGVLRHNGKADTGGASVPASSGAPSSDMSELARRVIAGEFGNGDARRAALGSRYDEVQAEVNRILSGGSSASYDVDALARRVIAGEFGNGTSSVKQTPQCGVCSEKARALSERGLWLGNKYGTVQKRVNEILGAAGRTKTSVDVDAMTRAVIRGDYGNGDERKRRLGSYYSIVQARVNEMLS